MIVKCSSWRRGLCFLLIGAALTGCINQDMQDLRLFVEQVKGREPSRIEPLPEIKQIETFAYESGERRNPFRPVEQGSDEMQELEANGIAPDPNRRKEELENYSLDSLRMVGTLEQLETMWALIQTGEKTIYRVKAGNYLGRNHGQITRIDETEVELTEIVSDGLRGYRERQASLALKEK